MIIIHEKKKKDSLIISIERWLKKSKGSTVKLASALGYTSSQAIYNWLYRGSVPKYRHDAVKDFLRNERRKK